MSASLRDLKVWQEAVILAGDLTRALRTASTGGSATQPLTHRIMLTAVGIAEQIADGHARFTTTEQREVYRAAKRDLLALETQITIAKHADMLPVLAITAALTSIQLLHKLLAGYLVYLDRQIAEEKEGAQ